jgi:hypothetical protein
MKFEITINLQFAKKINKKIKNSIPGSAIK